MESGDSAAIAAGLLSLQRLSQLQVARPGFRERKARG